MVVGASRGLGRGIAAAFADAGSPVIAVARTAQALRDLATGTAGIEAEIAGAADPTVPGALLDRHQPDTVIVVAGASPLMRPLHQHTWETFSADWNTDVRVAFHWLREALITLAAACRLTATGPDRAALTQIRADHRWRTVRLGP